MKRTIISIIFSFLICIISLPFVLSKLFAIEEGRANTMGDSLFFIFVFCILLLSIYYLCRSVYSLNQQLKLYKELREKIKTFLSMGLFYVSLGIVVLFFAIFLKPECIYHRYNPCINEDAYFLIFVPI